MNDGVKIVIPAAHYNKLTSTGSARCSATRRISVLANIEVNERCSGSI